MLYKNLLSAAVFAGSALAAPAASQLPDDGFPNPNANQLEGISQLAGGTLSNAPPPASLSPSSIPIFQLIAFNENFEVAFFNSLINNITNEISGYQIPFGSEKAALLSVLENVLNVSVSFYLSSFFLFSFFFPVFSPPSPPPPC